MSNEVEIIENESPIIEISDDEDSTFPRQLDLRSGTTRIIFGQRLSTQRQLYKPKVFSPGKNNRSQSNCYNNNNNNSTDIIVLNSDEEESSEDKAYICIALKEEQEVHSTKKHKRRFQACRRNTLNAQTTDSGQVNKVAKSSIIIDNSNEIRNSAALENYSNESNNSGNHNINENYAPISDCEDSADVIVINSVEEEASEDDKANICIKLNDEQEEVHMDGFTNSVNNDANLDDTITDLINHLDSNCTNTHIIESSLADKATSSVNNLESNIRNTNSTKKRKRRRRRFRACRRNTAKTSQYTDIGHVPVNKVSKSSIIIENTNEVHNSAVLENYSNGSNNNVHHNNENYTTIVNELSNCSSSIGPDFTESATNRSKNYDFSKLKWLKPLNNLSSPAHLQIVIIDRNHPNWSITNDKWLMIEKRLLEALNSEMLRTNDTNIGLFDGAKWHRGIKIVGCHNKNAFNFITKFILELDKLWCGAKLDVFPITYITRHVVKVYIPPPTVKTEIVLSLIQLQNPSIHGEDLKVLRECERTNNDGVDIWFSVNDETFTNLCTLRGEIKYGINRIFFKPSQ
ncbi:homeobox protein 2-like [Calliphora vicina]|uniref:homeobox protein 2-like n=1 Tax=Calliphora vicina TaxID=7373 RepID=UPI00325B89F4